MKAALVLNGHNLDIGISEDIIICADGGYRHVKDKKVFAVIGDFDSLDFEPTTENIVRAPQDKDFTDGELAIDFAKENGISEITLYAFTGGRLDHEIANLYLLKYADKRGVKAIAKSKDLTVYYTKEKLEIKAKKGDIISIIPVGDKCLFNKSFGLKYQLSEIVLENARSGLGISNIALEDKVIINIRQGDTFVFHNTRMK